MGAFQKALPILGNGGGVLVFRTYLFIQQKCKKKGKRYLSLEGG